MNRSRIAGLVAVIAVAVTAIGGAVTAQEDPDPYPPEAGFCQDVEGQTPPRECDPGELPFLEEGFFYMRLAGHDRYGTAAITEGIEETPHRMLVVASGANPIDAMFVSDNLARHGQAFLLPVPPTGPLPESIRFAIHDYTDITMVVVIGGRNAVSDEVFMEVVAEAAKGAGPGR